jgi:hypothetical protein
MRGPEPGQCARAELVSRVAQRVMARRARDPRALIPEPPADEAELAASEQILGFVLSPLLKRLYLEVGNGGWGPGYGLMVLSASELEDEEGSAVAHYLFHRRRTAEDPSWHWPVKLLPICEWGCLIYSCIDCSLPDFPVIAFDTNMLGDGAKWSDAFFPECDSFDEWIELWTEGENLWDRLYAYDGTVARVVEERQASCRRRATGRKKR